LSSLIALLLLLLLLLFLLEVTLLGVAVVDV